MIPYLKSLLLTVCLGLGLHASVNAADLISARAWLADPTGTLTLDQVKQRDLTPFDNLLGAGIGKGVLWVRLTLDPSRKSRALIDQGVEKLLLHIRPIYLDRIELFDPLTEGPARRITGDHFSSSTDDFKSLDLSFVIDFGDAPRDIYLRIETTSIRFLYVEAYSASEMLQIHETLQMEMGIYLGAGALFLVLALITWVITRDPVILAFSVSQTFALLLGFFFFGYARLFLSDPLSPELIDQLLTFLKLGAVTATVWFYSRFLLEFAPPVIGIRLLQICGLLFIPEAMLVLMGYTGPAVVMNWMVTVAVPVIALATVLLSKGWNSPDESVRLLPRWSLLLYFSTQLVILLTTLLSAFGVLPVFVFSIYGLLTNSLVSSALAIVLLQYRSSLNKQHHDRLISELRISERVAREERAYRVDQERLLTMLAHELKTPLSVISIALGPTENSSTAARMAKNAVHDIRDIIDQCVEADRLNPGQIESMVSSMSLKDVMSEVCQRLPELEQRLLVKGAAEIEIKSDVKLIKIILLNLFNNALRYGASGNPIVLDIHADEQSGVVLGVQNTVGPAGIPDPEHIFTKYYRAPAAQHKSGSGLGLYLAKTLALKLGGELKYALHSPLITFTLCIPKKNPSV